MEKKAQQSRRILIVDDEVNVAGALQEGLGTLPDCEVESAHDSAQALRLFEQQPFDLVITDYRMPGDDGLDLAEDIHHRYPATTIIMITAYDNEQLRERAAGVAVQQVLNKPIDLVKIRTLALEIFQVEELN